MLRRDPGGRGLAGAHPPGSLRAAAELLLGLAEGGAAIGVATGFPVQDLGGDWRPETDGPLGAVHLGEALAGLGGRPVYLAGPLSRPVLQALGVEVSGLSALSDFPEPGALEGLVAVELPSRARDGSYRNMRGHDVSEAVAGLDAAFWTAAEQGVPTVGIGDGGNEVGLANLSRRVQATIPHGPTLAAVVGTQVCLAAGVSTWGAWALIGALAVLAGRSLLPDAPAVQAGLAAMQAAGAVDGVTRSPASTLDGRPLAESLEVIRILQRAAGEAGVQGAGSGQSLEEGA